MGEVLRTKREPVEPALEGSAPIASVAGGTMDKQLPEAGRRLYTRPSAIPETRLFAPQIGTEDSSPTPCAPSAQSGAVKAHVDTAGASSAFSIGRASVRDHAWRAREGCAVVDPFGGTATELVRQFHVSMDRAVYIYLPTLVSPPPLCFSNDISWAPFI